MPFAPRFGIFLLSILFVLLQTQPSSGALTEPQTLKDVKRQDPGVAKSKVSLPEKFDARTQLGQLQPPKITTEILSGTILGLANVPSSIAFAGIAGLHPLTGIWTSFFVGLTSALYGGRPGLIAATASAVCVPLSKITKTMGGLAPEYMQATVLLASALQAAFSLLKLGNLISLVTQPSLFGFMNGLGLVIAKVQMGIFAGLSGIPLLSTVLVALATALTVTIVPKFTTAVPSPLVALPLATVVSSILDLPLKTLGDLAGPDTFSGGLKVLPSVKTKLLPDIPYTKDTLALLFPVAMSISVITFLQTLLASKAVEDAPIKNTLIPETKKNRALMGVALGSSISTFFGGCGGCGLLPFTQLNMNCGGRGMVSSLTQPLCLALFVMVFAPLIAHVPMAAMAGLMFTVARSSIKPLPSYQMAQKAFSSGAPGMAKVDFLALCVSSIVCFKVDMAMGIVLGIVIDRIGRLVIEKMGQAEEGKDSGIINMSNNQTQLHKQKVQ